MKEQDGGNPMNTHNEVQGGITENLRKEVMRLVSEGMIGKQPIGPGFFVIRAEEHTASDEMIVDRITVEGDEFLILNNFG